MSSEMKDKAPQTSDIIFYTSPQGAVKVEVIFNDETFWLTQKRMGELFGVEVRTVNEHLQNIYNTDELVKEATIRKIRTVQKEGNREVNRELDFYNLDAIMDSSTGKIIQSIISTSFA